MIQLLNERGEVTSTIVGMQNRTRGLRPLALDDVLWIHGQVQEFGHPKTVLRVRFASGDVLEVPASEDFASASVK